MGYVLRGLLIMFAAVVGSSAMGGFFTWMYIRTRRLDAGGRSSDELAQVLEQLEELREGLDLTRQDVAELGERLDFTERLLTRGAPENPGLLKPEV